MRQKISLKALIPHGKVDAKFNGDALEFSPKVMVNDYLDPRAPGLILPGKFKLPFSIDLTVNMDAVGLRLAIGNGIIPFTAGWNGRAIIDLVCGVPKTYSGMKMFDASFELNKDTDISVTYDHKFMMIKINGDIRYFSKKEKYMKSPLLEEENSFEIKIAAEKLSTVAIKSISVTEGLQEAIETEEISLDIPAGVDKGKESFEACIAYLPEAARQEIIQTNDHLLSMKKQLKIKRSIEGTHKGCRIKYNSTEFGFGYHIIVSHGWASHFFWFSMHFSYKHGDFGARKCDYTEAMLQKITEKSPESAARIFDYYGECGICPFASHGSKCPTVYEYSGVKKTTCHGKMNMNMKPETFGDVRIVFDALYEITGGNS